MIEGVAATVDEMVLAFLKAEAWSEATGHRYQDIAHRKGLDLARLVNTIDFSETANRARRDLLACVRGYGRGQALFRDFPAKTNWRRVEIESSDHCRLLYINDRNWQKFSRTRRVHHANDEIKSRVAAMIDAIDHGITFMELILVECGISDLVVLAGNHRATAYLAASTTRPFPALVGKSDTMNRWCSIEFS
jgi:hypothetical protein